MSILNSFFSPEVSYNINVILGLIGIGLSIFGIYIVYRWSLTILTTDQDVREKLMGKPFSDWFSGDESIKIFASVYLAYRIIKVFLAAANWEASMSRQRKMYREKYNQDGT